MHFFNMRQMHKPNSKKSENEEKQSLIGLLQWHNSTPPPGLNFIKVLRTAFAHADPESVKRY